MHLSGVVYKRWLRIHVPQHVVPSDSRSAPSPVDDGQRSCSQIFPSIILQPPESALASPCSLLNGGPLGKSAGRGEKVIKQATVVIAKYANGDQKGSENGKWAVFLYLKKMELQVSEQRGIKDT